jgi:hypothetical protein
LAETFINGSAVDKVVAKLSTVTLYVELPSCAGNAVFYVGVIKLGNWVMVFPVIILCKF